MSASAAELVAAGNRAEGESRVREACELYRRAIETDPAHAPGYLNLGAALESLAEPEGAADAYRALLGIEAANPHASYNLGRLRFAAGAAAEAEGLLRDALRARPQFPEARLMLAIALDAQGKLTAFRDHFVTFSNSGKVASSATLSATEFPAGYVPNLDLGFSMMPLDIPTGPMRAPGSNTLAFAYQSFLDELAHAAGKDPLQFQLDLLGPAKPPVVSQSPFGPTVGFDNARMAGVLKAVAEKAGWGKKKLPKGTGLGLAAYFSHQGYFAEVVQASVSSKSGEVRVEKVWVAGDVGRQIVNPSAGGNQVEGSAIDGVSQALAQALTFTNGSVDQSNFHDYPLLRMHQAPKVEVHFVMTDNNPTGLGEPAMPPVVPALTNAIFAATGKRVRTLPINTSELKGFASMS